MLAELFLKEVEAVLGVSAGPPSVMDEFKALGLPPFKGGIAEHIGRRQMKVSACSSRQVGVEDVLGTLIETHGNGLPFLEDAALDHMLGHGPEKGIKISLVKIVVLTGMVAIHGLVIDGREVGQGVGAFLDPVG